MTTSSSSSSSSTPSPSSPMNNMNDRRYHSHPTTTTFTQPSYDVRRLLQHAARAEQQYHPPQNQPDVGMSALPPVTSSDIVPRLYVHTCGDPTVPASTHHANDITAMTVIIAYTDHTISAQLYHNIIPNNPRQDPNHKQPPLDHDTDYNPMEVFVFGNQHDDHTMDTDHPRMDMSLRNEDSITCLTVVDFPPLEASSTVGRSDHPQPPATPVDDTAKTTMASNLQSSYHSKSSASACSNTNSPNSSSSNSITKTSSLMKGTMMVHPDDHSIPITTIITPPLDRTEYDLHDNQNNDAKHTIQPTKATNAPPHFAIVFGTTNGRVYTMEMSISPRSNQNENHKTGIQLKRIECPVSRRYLFQLLMIPTDTDTDTGGRTTTVRDTPQLHTRTQTSVVPSNSTVSNMFTSTVMQMNDLTYVWIVHQNLTYVRVHSRCCFPSWTGYPTTSRMTVEGYMRQRSLPPSDIQCESIDTTHYVFEDSWIVRCEVNVPHHRNDDRIPSQMAMVLPLPRYMPSAVAPLLDMSNSLLSSKPNTYHSRPTFDTTKREHFQALVYFPSIGNRRATMNDDSCHDLNPTFAFYTTEGTSPSLSSIGTMNNMEHNRPTSQSMEPPRHSNHLNEHDEEDDDDDYDDGILLVSVTKAIVGTAFGAIRWGLTGGGSGGAHRNESSPNRDGSDSTAVAKRKNHTNKDGNVNRQPFVKRPEPIPLHMSTAFHDLPRMFEHCSVDPEGRLVAAADSLGRILLIDVSTKHIIRLWKGFRDATCYWIQQFRNSSHDSKSRNQQKLKNQLYVVIHSRQRRIVEVWPVRYGDRILSISVGRDAKVIPFWVWATNCTQRIKQAQCCIAQSTVPGSNFNMLEIINISNNIDTSASIAASNVATVSNSSTRGKSKGSISSPKPSGVLSRNGALRLKQLQQLLSATQIQCTIDDVRDALHEITPLDDLATAIDLLATSPGLENKLKVDGASFHCEVVKYCQDILTTIIRPGGTVQKDSSIKRNPHVRVLTQKIAYHEQLLKAYNSIYLFGTTIHATNVKQVKSPSHWAAEAMAWASTNEQVTGVGLDSEISGLPMHRLHFTEFASSCKLPDATADQASRPFKIFFSDSSRSRQSILEFVFLPLLGDAFSLAVTDSVFDVLHIKSEYKYIQVCFAEWFMTLSVRDACKKGLYADLPPMLQFLRALTLQEISSGRLKDSEFALNSIYQFCEGSVDLVRAFMLAVLCLEAVAKAMTQNDKDSPSKDVATRSVSNWKSLLRKVRVCLLVSLRLHGNEMLAPITIENINQPDIFSIFEWLALDELTMSHNHDEIVSLEKACSISSYAFDPSLPDGDGPSRFKIIQSSCLAATITEEERAEYLVDFSDDDRFGALLLFLGSHNIPKLLAAHRTLLLVNKWGTDPKSLHLVHDAVVSLKSLSITDGYKSLAAAVSVEIWQSRLCPIFRAYLFGFTDIHELSEDIVSPLIQDSEWFAAVGRIGLHLLAILQECTLEKPSDFSFELAESVERWPPLRSDIKLQKLIDKMPPHVEESALNIHSVVLCAFLVSSDINAFAQCIPSLHDLFLPFSLFQPMASSTNVPELQQKYLNNAIVTFAMQYTGPAMDSFELGEIITLAKLWNFNPASVRTIFLIAMYELGKDQIVDELVTKASFLIDGKYFVERGVSIACVRLNGILNNGSMKSSKIRNAIGVLDAELCEWIKQRASKSISLVASPALDVPIESTHLFFMRQLSISVSSNVDKDLRIRIHSLVVLSGILMKALSA